MLFGIFIVVAVFLFLAHSKIEHNELRRKAKKHKVVVVKYELEKSPMRNDYTKLAYPYVRFVEIEKSGIVKLKYAENQKEIFKIGEEILAFWCGTDLLYYHAYDNGFYKIFPDTWNIFEYYFRKK